MDNQIRAEYSNESITVYQAYNKTIAEAAVRNQKFVSPPFKLDRMTWIKPSFLWMMYRSGWGHKDPNQTNILAIKIKRAGFDWAIAKGCLSHYDSTLYSSEEDWKKSLAASPVRIQWDPERDINLNRCNERTIQIGLMGEAVDRYINDWTLAIEDITEKCQIIHQLVLSNNSDKAMKLLPIEKPYFINS